MDLADNQQAKSVAVFPFGWTVWHALLAGIYYLVVTPLGPALRLCGYDPLSLRRR